MRRQPEIGSGIDLTSAEVAERARDRDKRLRATRSDLTAALASAMESLNHGTPPIDVTRRLYWTLEGVLDRWRS